MEDTKKTGGNIILENRERLSITGVTEVKNFDEDKITLDTTCGVMTVEGHELHVEKLSLETGEMTVGGMIDGLKYFGTKGRQGIFGRMFQ